MLVTPLLLLMFAGIFDFAMMFRSWEVVTNAAREGARIAILPGYSGNENVVARVQQYMASGGVLDAGVTCTEQTINGAGKCPATACSVCVKTTSIATPAGTFSGRSVAVVANQTLPSLSGFAPFFGGSFGTFPVGSISTMRSEAAVSGP